MLHSFAFFLPACQKPVYAACRKWARQQDSERATEHFQPHPVNTDTVVSRLTSLVPIRTRQHLCANQSEHTSVCVQTNQNPLASVWKPIRTYQHLWENQSEHTSVCVETNQNMPVSVGKPIRTHQCLCGNQSKHANVCVETNQNTPTSVWKPIKTHHRLCGNQSEHAHVCVECVECLTCLPGDRDLMGGLYLCIVACTHLGNGTGRRAATMAAPLSH